MNIQAKPQDDALRLDGLKTIRVDDQSFGDESFVYAESTVASPRSCPFCSPAQTTIHRNGGDESRFKDVTAWGRMTTIIVKRQRYLCKDCNRTWTEKIPSLHEQRMMTIRLQNHIIQRCSSTTQIDIARAFGIDEGTVRNIFRDYIAEKERTRHFETPRILGIDEIHLSDVRCVLTNVGERSVFDILPSRTKEKLTPYFADLPDKGNVQVVVADMWRAYHDLADRFFPGRLVVVDKFHVVRMAHNGLDIVRKASGRSRTHEEKIRLKDERFLLHKRKQNLSGDEWEKVGGWLRAFPMLKLAYETKERFTDAFDAPNRREGAKAIDRCLQSVPVGLDAAFEELTRAVGNWKPQILNYFEEPATNAYTEAINSLIRQDDRTGRGYSFEVMRARILFNETARKKKTSTRGRRPGGIPEDAIGFFDMSRFLGPHDDKVVDYGPDIETIVAMLERERLMATESEKEE